MTTLLESLVGIFKKDDKTPRKGALFNPKYFLPYPAEFSEEHKIDAPTFTDSTHRIASQLADDSLIPEVIRLELSRLLEIADE